MENKQTPRDWTQRIERDLDAIDWRVWVKQDTHIWPETQNQIREILQNLVKDVQSATEEDISGRKSVL